MHAVTGKRENAHGLIDQNVDVTALAAPRAGRREWAGLAVLALACLLYAMDLTVLHLAVPSLSADLRPSSAQLLWITDIYGFMVAGFLVTMGTLGDRIGRRRLLLSGAAGDRRGDPSAVHAVADLQHVRRPQAALDRHRRVNHQLLGRWRDRPSAWRGAAGALLVGLGVPAGGAGDGAAAGAGTARAARIPRPRRWPAGPGQRGYTPGRRADGDLRHQADRPERDLLARRRRHPWRAGDRRGIRRPAVSPGRPADRPWAVPGRGVQRVAGDQPARHLHRGRLLPVRRAVPAAGAGAVAAAGGPVVAAVGRWVHRGVQ